MAEARYVVGAKSDGVSNPHDAVKAIDKDVEVLGTPNSRYITVVTTPENMGRIQATLGQDYVVEGQILFRPLAARRAQM